MFYFIENVQAFSEIWVFVWVWHKYENNCFIVYGKNGKFYWHVYGKRSDIAVEVNKTETNVKGNGPYLWVWIYLNNRHSYLLHKL